MCALVKFGAGVSEMRGKEGGVIYSRNAYGSYIKTKVSPVNPQTAKQQAQRSLMGNLSAAWAGLSAAQKAAWDNLGEQTTRVNRFGDSTIYTGFSLFMRLNRNLTVIGQATIDAAPTPPTIPVLTIGEVLMSESGATATVAFTPTTPGTGLYLLLEATNNIFGGRRFVKNFYRSIGSYSNPTTSPQSFYTEWLAYFSNTLSEGATVFLRAKLIDSATGFDGVPDVSSGVVQA